MKLTDRKTATNTQVTPALALAFGLCLAFTQTACAESTTPAATVAQDAVADKAPASAEIAPPEEKAAPRFSAGMQIPVDGTSLEAFEASLADIKGKATADEYVSLDGAIDYLMVYDLSAGRNKTKLAANLNGLTGEEIVDRVAWKQPSAQKKPKTQ